MPWSRYGNLVHAGKSERWHGQEAFSCNKILTIRGLELDLDKGRLVVYQKGRLVKTKSPHPMNFEHNPRLQWDITAGDGFTRLGSISIPELKGGKFCWMVELRRPRMITGTAMGIAMGFSHDIIGKYEPTKTSKMYVEPGTRCSWVRCMWSLAHVALGSVVQRLMDNIAEIPRQNL
jgi:hypothetical protein